MDYALPDVFVNVTVPEPTPTVQSPDLRPCMLGAHYHVAKDEYVDSVAPGDSGPWSYPDLPTSAHTGDALDVDVEDDRFDPTFHLVTGDGTSIDVTDQIDATSDSFDVAASGDFPESGALYVSYRARHDKYAGDRAKLLVAASYQDLTNYFGAEGIAPANPLGYAMWQSLQRGNVETVGAAITNPQPTDGSSTYSGSISNVGGAYQSALDFLEVESVHTIVPLTTNEYVHSLLESHVDAMSGPQGNEERRAIVVPEIGDDTTIRRGDDFTAWYPITDSSGTDLADAFSTKNVGAEVTRGGYTIVKAGDSTYYIRGYVPGGSGSDTVTLEGTDYEVSFSGMMLVELPQSAISPPSRRIEASDDFLFMDGGTETTATIQSVALPQHEAIVEIDAAGADPTEGAPWQVTRTLDPTTDRAEFVRAYKSKARGVSNQRVTMLTPAWVGSTTEEMDVRSFYAAAQLAGEAARVSVEPAGASPGVEPFAGLRDSTAHLFKSTRYFTREELEEIAGSGWTILANDRPGQEVNTLHTLTTDASSVEMAEFILGVERDYLARFFRRELKEDLRQFRISSRTLQAVALRAEEVATTLSDPGSQHYRYRNCSVTGVEQDESQPDRILIDVEAEHLYPYNQGKVSTRILT